MADQTISHQSDVTEVSYPGRTDLPSSAPRDAGEVFDIVVRKGPISHNDMMRNQIYSMSSDEVARSLLALQEEGYVDNVDGDLEEHGTTREVWYVPTGDGND